MKWDLRVSSVCLLLVCALALGFQLCCRVREDLVECGCSMGCRCCCSEMFVSRPPAQKVLVQRPLLDACVSAGFEPTRLKRWRVRCAGSPLLATCVCSCCSSLRVTRLGCRGVHFSSAVTKRDCDPLYLMRAYLNILRVLCAQQPSVFVVHCLAAGNLLAL